METRQEIGYGLIIVAVVALSIWSLAAIRKKRLDRLRRRGIKTYGH
jgi:hypothetical protein